MSPEQIAFAKRYGLFMRVMSWLVRVRPGWLYRLLARTVGRWLNPFALRRAHMQQAMACVLPPQDVHRVWQQWLDSHIRFACDFLHYGRLDAQWLKDEVVVRDAAEFAALRASGGLLLIYHTHHQNTLCCALGLMGCQVSAVAAAPEDSPLFPYIGRWAQRVNADSQLHFRGGHYLFLSDLRALARSVKAVLSSQSVLVSLCDFHQPGPAGPSGQVLGRTISPPTGVIDLAIKQGAPIFAAMFAPRGGKLELRTVRIGDAVDAAQVVARYLGFLETCVRDNPSCWQGWEWLQDLKVIENRLNDEKTVE